jgi:hypothetical protein
MRSLRLIACLGLCAGCAPEKPPAPKPPARAIVELRDGRLLAPDTLPAGPIRLRLVRADSAGHNVVVFALAKDTDPESFARSLDVAPETPAPVIARGGAETPPEPGDTSDVYLTLEPGRYLLGCMIRGFASSRHVSAGEWKVVTVVPSEAETPPAATIELGLADFAFQSEPQWPAGDQMIKVSNIGTQEHIVLIDRLDPGHTLQQWIAAQGDAPWSHSLGGVSRLGPGQSVLLPRTLVPGRYILVCLFVDPKSGKPHVELGMLREITVGPAS